RHGPGRRPVDAVFDDEDLGSRVLAGAARTLRSPTGAARPAVCHAGPNCGAGGMHGNDRIRCGVGLQPRAARRPTTTRSRSLRAGRAGRRAMNLLLWNILLAITWMLARGDFSLGGMLVGLLLGWLALWLARRAL